MMVMMAMMAMMAMFNVPDADNVLQYTRSRAQITIPRYFLRCRRALMNIIWQLGRYS
jgi:hypothetical protein